MVVENDVKVNVDNSIKAETSGTASNVAPMDNPVKGILVKDDQRVEETVILGNLLNAVTGIVFLSLLYSLCIT